jgi:hypothetical protein
MWTGLVWLRIGSSGFLKLFRKNLPPMWSSGQRSQLQICRSRVRFPHYKKSSGSGTGSTQPREYI